MLRLLTRFSTRIGRSTALLMMFLLPLLGWGQTTIFYTAGTLPLGAVGANNNSTSPIEQGSGAGAYLLVETNPTDVITTGIYNMSPYTSGTFTLDVATFGSGGNNPAKIEISLNGGTSYTAFTSVTPTSSSYVTTTSIALPVVSSQVRLRISNNGTTGRGVRMQNLRLTGSGTATTPYLVVASSPTTSPTTLTGFTASAGTASASQTLNLSGANLTAGNAITVTAPTDFEVSTDNTTFGATASLPNPAGGALASTPIYVRLKAGPTAGTYNNETVSVTGGGTSLATLATVSGTVTAGPAATLGTPTFLAGANPTTANPGGAFCSTASINLGVSFTSTGTFNASNNFIVELSGPTGSFTTPFATATVTNATTAPGTAVGLAIPAGTNSGSGYLIRVRSTSPATTSTSSVAFIIINDPQVTIDPPITQTYVTGTPAVPFRAIESFSVGTTRQWQVGTAATGPFTSIPGETGITFTPSFSTPGTYFVNVVSTFAACGSVTSDNVAEVIVNPLPTTSINTPTFPTAVLCATTAASLDVTFTATGTYAAGNTFTIQLSDAAGTFASPVTIGTISNTLTTAQTVSTTIPAGTPTGTGYLIRVVASAPATTSAGTSAALTILSNPAITVAGTTPQTFNTSGTGTAVTASTTSTVTPTYQWYYSTTANSNATATAISGATSASYTPTAADLGGAVGTFYVSVRGTFPGCGAVVGSPEIVVNVTAAPAAPLLAYNFTSGDTPSTQNANVTGSAFSRVGVTSNAGSGRYNSTGWAGGNTADAAKYVTFNFTPNAGFKATLTSLSFVNQRSGTGPTSFEVRSSADNYTAALLSGTVTGTAANAPAVATLSGTAFTDIAAGTGVTFRFYAYNSGGGTYSVDEVQLFGTVTPDNTPRLAASPTTLSFTATTGQAAPTDSYTLSASNLAANATVTITSSDPAVLVSTTGGAPFGATATATASATGTLSQVVTVQFTAPGTASTTTATIANTDGTTTATVTVTGTATAPPAPTITNFTPINGPVGTTVTITGTGFTGAIGVAFNGTPATTVTVVSATSVTAVVPTGATTGTITVSNATGSATSTGVFTVTGPPPAAVAAGFLVLEDDFNYAANTTLATNGWATHSGASSNDQPTVVSGNIANANATYPTGPLAPNANQVLVNSTGADVNKGFSLPSGQNVVYYSTLLNIPVGGTFPDYFLHLLERTNTSGTNTQNFRAKLFARSGSTANTFNLGVSITSNSGQTPSPIYTATEYAEGQTLLAVVKYVYTPGGSDAVSLFVFDSSTPVPAIEPATPSAGPLLETNSASFSLPNGIAIRQTPSSSAVNLDGIRVATGWGSVVGNATYTESTATINPGNYHTLTMADAAARLALNGPVNVENVLNLTQGLINTTATNALTLYAGATTTGGNATSFVNGPLARVTAGPATTVFPIGKGTAYRPLTLRVSSQTSVTTYRAEQVEGDPGQLGTVPTATNGTTLTRVSRIRSFTITPFDNNGVVTQPTGFQGQVTLSFDADDRVTNAVNLELAKRADSTQPWANIGLSGGVINGATGGYQNGAVTSGIFSSFSDFALASTEASTTNNPLANSNPLPVELTAFAAQRQSDKSVAIRWTTASEKNSSRFEVQRSLNGRDFVTVATVVAQGTSMKPTAYTALDQAAPAAMLYYRLKQVDLDGTVAYSPIATVAGTGATSKVLLYPNPAHSSISFITEAATPYRVLNQLGQAVLHGTTETGTAKVGVEQLPTGLYFIELQTATGRVVQKFEKE